MRATERANDKFPTRIVEQINKFEVNFYAVEAQMMFTRYDDSAQMLSVDSIDFQWNIELPVARMPSDLC